MNINLQTKTIIVWVFLVILTTFAICIIYDDLYVLNKWPWMRASMIMSTFTCLWVYAVWFSHGGKKDSGILPYEGVDYFSHGSKRKPPVVCNIFFFIVVAVPLNILLCYPGYERLGIDSNQGYSYYSYLLFSLMSIHGTGFWVLQRWTKQYLDDRFSAKE